MNLSTRLSELKRQRQRSAEHESRGAAAPRGRGWRWLIIAGLCFASAAATFFVFDRFVLTGSRQLVGLWGVDGGPQDGATLEFFADGSFRANANDRGKGVPVRGRYRVDGKKLTLYTKNPAGEEVPLTKTIEHLDAAELRLRDASGEIMKLVRLNEENRP